MAIRIDGISKRFGDFQALNNVSLDIPDGELTALLGPSGSGKSTLLRIIAGLETPDAGAIWIGDEDVSRVSPQKRGIGFVFQHYAPFKHMSVRDNVAFGLTIRKRPKAEINKRVTELLKLVQIEQFGDRYPAQLSGGQRQRMALARALAVEPSVLLLDEPFGALDARVRKELRSWLRRLHEETHVTTVFVTHDQEEAMDVSDTIVVMEAGRIEQVGPPRELYEHPANEFVMGFIGEVNRLGDSWVRPHDIDILQHEAEGSVEAMIERVVYLGFEVRVELVRRDGSLVWAQLPRDEAERLELNHGQIVNTRARSERTFPVAARAAAEAQQTEPVAV
jgi:sulfate transport system ATP-binding protein